MGDSLKDMSLLLYGFPFVICLFFLFLFLIPSKKNSHHKDRLQKLIGIKVIGIAFVCESITLYLILICTLFLGKVYLIDHGTLRWILLVLFFMEGIKIIVGAFVCKYLIKNLYYKVFLIIQIFFPIVGILCGIYYLNEIRKKSIKLINTEMIEDGLKLYKITKWQLLEEGLFYIVFTLIIVLQCLILNEEYLKFWHKL